MLYFSHSGTTSYQAMNASIKATAKRYRYTGKERDEESGLYYHGARYYIPWLARWLSPDPINSNNYNLAKGYGLEKNKERQFLDFCASSYEYCFANPIRFSDPSGEQANPLAHVEQEYNSLVKYIKQQYFGTAKKITQEAGKAVIQKIMEGAVLNYILKNGYDNDTPIAGNSVTFGSNTLKTDTQPSSANEFNLYVNFDGYTQLDDEVNLRNFKDYESAIIATMMYNFVEGVGPENYYFSENGYISSKFIENKSSILIEALETFLGNTNKDYSDQPRFDSKGLKKDIRLTGTIYSISGMTGSAWIDIKNNEERGGVEISIFNVTSITSGSFGKEVDISTNHWPTSKIRNKADKTPFGNISQTFNLFIPYSDDPNNKYSNVQNTLNKMK